MRHLSPLDNLVKRFKTLAAKKGRIDASALDAPKDVLMEKLHLTNAGYYTNAAMLLFGKDPDKWQLGTCIEKICNACQKDGSPQPEFPINPEDIMIKFTAAENRIIRSVTPSVTEKITERVTEKEQQVLNLIIEDPVYTSQMMADKLSLSRKTSTERLRSLKDKGIIQRIGSDTRGYWKINEWTGKYNRMTKQFSKMEL